MSVAHFIGAGTQYPSSAIWSQMVCASAMYLSMLHPWSCLMAMCLSFSSMHLTKSALRSLLSKNARRFLTPSLEAIFALPSFFHAVSLRPPLLSWSGRLCSSAIPMFSFFMHAFMECIHMSTLALYFM